MLINKISTAVANEMVCFDKTGLEIVSTCADYIKYISVLKGS